MTLKIRQEQYNILESQTIRRKLKAIVLTYANELELKDPDLANRIRSLDEQFCLTQLTNIYNVTQDRFYQRALLALLVSTGVAIFDREEFTYILQHPFLSGDAKVRHILLSGLSLSKRSKIDMAGYATLAPGVAGGPPGWVVWAAGDTLLPIGVIWATHEAVKGLEELERSRTSGECY
jgi:hypothetical protein